VLGVGTLAVMSKGFSAVAGATSVLGMLGGPSGFSLGGLIR
jgi:hypothetical protein